MRVLLKGPMYDESVQVQKMGSLDPHQRQRRNLILSSHEIWDKEQRETLTTKAGSAHENILARVEQHERVISVPATLAYSLYRLPLY